MINYHVHVGLIKKNGLENKKKIMLNQGMCLVLLPNSQKQHLKKSVLNSKEKTDVVTATAPRMFYLHSI